MANVPFTVPNLYGCLAECHGLLRGEGPSLVLEFQLQDNLFGWLRRGPKTIRVPLAELESIELRKRWMSGADLVITAKSLTAVAAVPGSRQGRIQLRINKNDVQAAEQFVASAYETSVG